MKKYIVLPKKLQIVRKVDRIMVAGCENSKNAAEAWSVCDDYVIIYLYIIYRIKY
jgi:hypothetical protein